MKKILAISMVVVMLLTLSVTAFAAVKNPSPTKPGTEYKIDVKFSEGGTATYKENPDGTYTLTAVPGDGHAFTKWIIDGKYEIVSGSVTDKEITIRAKSDLNILASFDGKTTPIVNPWKDKESPETGNEIAVVAAVAVAALFGCAWSVRKSVKD